MFLSQSMIVKKTKFYDTLVQLLVIEREEKWGKMDFEGGCKKVEFSQSETQFQKMKRWKNKKRRKKMRSVGLVGHRIENPMMNEWMIRGCSFFFSFLFQFGFWFLFLMFFSSLWRDHDVWC